MERHVGLDTDNLYQYFKTFLQACILNFKQKKKFAKGNSRETFDFGSDSKFWYN